MFWIINICQIQPRNLTVTFLMISCLGHMWLSNADPDPANIEQTLDVGVCRSASEYLEAMYRCKQSEFQVVTVCKKNKQEATPLNCPKLSRLAIYSAVFVEAADSPDAQSCATQATPSTVHECLSNSCQLIQVERRCHGKQKCSIGPDVYAREACVRPQYLNIIYICVTQKILKELKGDEVGPDSFCEGQTSEMPPEVPSNKSADIVSASRDIRTTSTSVPPANHVLLGTSTKKTKTTQDNAVHKNSRTARMTPDDWFWAPLFIKDNKEKLMLYLLLSIFVGLFLVLLVIILRLCLDFQCGRPTEHHLANSNSIRKQSSPESPDGGTPSNPNVELIRYTYSVTTPNDYHSSQQQQQQQQQQPQQQPHHQHYLYHTPPGSDGGKWTYNGGQPPTQTIEERRPPFSSAASSSGQDETDSATESRTLGRFYTNPYRHDSYRVDQMKTLQYRR